MATLTSKLTLTSTDLSTDSLDLSTSTTFTGSHTTGVNRVNLTSITKLCKIFIADGDLVVAQAGTHEGQFIDITDNHGLKKRYVFVDGAATSVATGDILVAGSDIGVEALNHATVNRLDLVDGIAVDVTDGLTQNAILALLATAINHANGHNGSIVATTPAGAANGNQSTTLTNRDSSSLPLVDSKNSTFSILQNDITVTTTLGAGLDNTNSSANHAVVIKKGEYTAPAIYYMKNTAAYHATNNIIYLYWSDTAATPFMNIHGGQFAYIPANPQHDLLAYCSTANTVLEHMAVGTEA